MNLSGDYFFFYGQVDERKEIESDLVQGVMQNKRSLFYDRSYGAGVPQYENTAGGLSLEVNMKYDITAWIAQRNREVSDGTKNTRDRRVITSQSAIKINQRQGEADIQVLYIPYFDYNNPGIIKVPLTV
jgi:hypothetical protein